MNKYTNIIKFAALTFAANEYFTYAKPALIELKEQQLNEKYNIENLNRSKKNAAEKEKATYLKKYKETLERISKHFADTTEPFLNSTNPDHNKALDFSIDLLHRTLDRFKVTEGGAVVNDSFKNYIFDYLDKIPPQERTEQDTFRFKAAFDNFLTTNKVIKR